MLNFCCYIIRIAQKTFLPYHLYPEFYLQQRWLSARISFQESWHPKACTGFTNPWCYRMLPRKDLRRDWTKCHTTLIHLNERLLALAPVNYKTFILKAKQVVIGTSLVNKPKDKNIFLLIGTREIKSWLSLIETSSLTKLNSCLQPWL